MKKSRYSEEKIIGILKEHHEVFRPQTCAASMGSATRRFTSCAYRKWNLTGQ